MRMLALPLVLAVAAGCGPKPVPKKVVDPVVEPKGFDWAAYPRVDITDASYVVLPADLAVTPGIEATLAAAGVPADKVPEVMSGSETTAWPEQFANEDARWTYSMEMSLMRARQIAYLDPDRVLVAVLADENQHLKAEVRPQHDFFAVLLEYGVQPLELAPARPGTQLDADRYSAVKIVDPERINAYPGLRYTDRIQEILTGAGVPETALEMVYMRSEDYWWPRGLRWDRRAGNSAEIPGFKGRKVAEIGRSVLVLIAAGENQHMADGLRPAYDFYLLVEAAGVTTR